jgi:hypothetical protein
MTGQRLGREQYMTDHEALQEARRRWGKEGVVKRRRRDMIPLGLKPCAVGKQNGELFESLGEGTSWAEAFEEAARISK